MRGSGKGETNGYPGTRGISDYPIAATLDEMWEQSDHVVLDCFDGLKEVRNMYRDSADPSKRSETDRFLGQIYPFTVEETLKGDAEG